MGEHQEKHFGSHPVLVLIGLIASVIGILGFATGKSRLSDFFESSRSVTQQAPPPAFSQESSSDVESIPPRREASALSSKSRMNTAVTLDAEVPKDKGRLERAQDMPASIETAPLEGAASKRSIGAKKSMVVTLDSENARDIWTTSVFSYVPGGRGPGGGLDNEKLLVGGWGDSYQSLIWFNLHGLPATVISARLELYAVAHEGGAGATPLLVDRITEPWDWKKKGTGSDRERLWWRDRPASEQIGTNYLPPARPGDWYSIDITRIYNSWQRGDFDNYGLQLRPVQTDNQWATFVSSNGSRSRLPQLVLEFESEN